jgi:hypothetical protein
MNTRGIDRKLDDRRAASERELERPLDHVNEMQSGK